MTGRRDPKDKQTFVSSLHDMIFWLGDQTVREFDLTITTKSRKDERAIRRKIWEEMEVGRDYASAFDADANLELFGVKIHFKVEPCSTCGRDD